MDNLSSERFEELYRRHWPEFASYLRTANASPPLLIHPPAGYSTQTRKLFIVGQQTRKWYDDAVDKTDLSSVMRLYEKYQLGLTDPRKVFWIFVRQLERALKVEPGAIIWSNLNKVDQAKGRPNQETSEAVRRLFPVLQSEIEIAKPDIVLFLTGPAFDSDLVRTFPEVVITDSKPLRIATLSHASLPKRSFRIYHPRYLRFRKLWAPVMDQIVAECEKP